MTKYLTSIQSLVGFGVDGDAGPEADKLEPLVGAKVAHGPETPEGIAATESEIVDGEWFATNRHRTRHLRPVLDGERISDHLAPGSYAVLVTQIRPGMRTRVHIKMTAGSVRKFCTANDDDDACADIAAFIVKAAPEHFQKAIREVTKYAAQGPMMEAVKDDDAAWFQENGPHRRRVRAPAPIERVIDPGTTVVVVSQLEKDMRVRRGLALPKDMTDFVLRNGEDAIEISQGEPIVIAPGSVVNGRILK